MIESARSGAAEHRDDDALRVRRVLIRGSRAPARDPKWAWVKRPFGWEAHSCASGGGACAPDAPKPVLYDAALLYSVKMSHEDVERGAQSSFILEVWEPEHSEATRASARLQAALDVARQFAEHIDAELIKYRWVAKLLQNGVARLARPVVAVQQLNLVAEDELSAHGALGSHELTVHLGDDLSVVAAWWAYQFDLSHEASESFFAQLSELFPQHSSASWIAAHRRARLGARCAVPARARDRADAGRQRLVLDDLATARRPGGARRHGTVRDDRDDDDASGCITSAPTARTLLAALDRGLARAHFALCSILVVDDGSPPHETRHDRRVWRPLHVFAQTRRCQSDQGSRRLDEHPPRSCPLALPGISRGACARAQTPRARASS